MIAQLVRTKQAWAKFKRLSEARMAIGPAAPITEKPTSYPCLVISHMSMVNGQAKLHLLFVDRDMVRMLK